MTLRPFLLERYFARFEFHTPLLLASSDCEALTMAELLALAGPEDLAAWHTLKLAYTESAGLPELRARIAAQYAGLTPEHVITAAPEEAIYLTLRSLLKPGDRIITTFPGYQSLYELAAAIGCRVEKWQPAETPSGWHFHPDRLAELAEPGARAIIVNFPHNPTGALPDPTEWARIIACAERHGALLISDEMYRGLEYEASRRLAPAAAATPLGLSIGGLSKAYGLAGLRAGWVASPDRDLLASIQAYKDYTTICASAPGERLALIALKNAATLIARCRGIVAANLPAVEAFMHTHAQWFQWNEPAAGPIAFPALRMGQSLRFCEDLAEQAGVMLLPASVYEYGDAHLRFGFGRSNLQEALRAVASFLAHYEPR